MVGNWGFISLSKIFFNNEVAKLIIMFRINGYLIRLLQQIIRNFNQDKLLEHHTRKNEEQINTIFVKIPYIGKKSHDFGKKLSTLFHTNFNIKITPVFSSFKVETFFKLKSMTPPFLTTNVVYEFVCSCDTSMSYIGVTTRPLLLRMREHIDCSPENKVESAIKKHISLCQKCFEETKLHPFKYFKIIRSLDTQYDAKIHEAIFIKNRNPTLNVQQHNAGSSFLLDIF